jgi:putative DNA primase/helicase
LNKWFEGRQCVFILEDNDAAGRSHARLVARSLAAVVKEVRIVSLPGLEEHGDVSDWIKAGGTKETLVELCNAAAIFIPRPMIHITPGNLSNAADQAEAVLVAAGVSLYQRAGKLVRPIIEQVEAARGQRTSVVHLKEVDATYLPSSKKAGSQLIDPPRDVALTILARAGEWNFRKVVGVISTPTMRPDGTILWQDGYDESTQLLLLGAYRNLRLSRMRWRHWEFLASHGSTYSS